MKRSIGLLAAAGLSLVGSASATDLVIGNFDAGIGVGTAFGSGSTTQFKAFGFVMGSESYNLDRVILSLNFTDPAFSPIVSVWSGSGFPQTELIVLDNPAFFQSGANDFVPPTAFELEAGQAYWVHMRPAIVGGGTSFGWDGTAPSTLPSGPAASAIGYNFNGSSSSFFNRLEVRGSAGGPVCVPDLNGDGVVDADDFFLFLQLFAAGDTQADINGDGVIDADDFFQFLNLFAAGC